MQAMPVASPKEGEGWRGRRGTATLLPMISGTLRSIQVGQPERFESDHGPWRTAIRKTAVASAHAGPLGLEGDAVADRRHHGGPHQAVLLYCAEHYPRWQAEWGGELLPGGAFGENLTVSGFDEATMCIGDRLEVGDVLLEVSKPRTPCRTLAWRHDRPGLVQEIQRNHRSGWYARVLQEGRLEPGLAVRLVDRPWPALTVAWTADVMRDRQARPADAAALADCPALCPEWRSRLRGGEA